MAGYESRTQGFKAVHDHGYVRAIVLDDSARDLMGEAGFDPVYGARPLKRAIQQQIENPLAQHILRGDFVPGDTIVVGVKDGRLTFSRSVDKAA